MRSTLFRNRVKQAAAIAFTLLLTATPGLAEAPLETTFETSSGTLLEAPLAKPTLTRQNNIRRLVLTNECAGCDLSGITLFEAHLIGADLRNAELTGADLTGANLEGADLEGANLSGANLTGAFLTDTSLANTQLVDVNFTGAHLYNTNVDGATMEDITLVGAEVFNTPISVGGQALPGDVEPGDVEPLEPMIPFVDTQPPVLYPELLLDPIL